ncbi:MAG: terpene cyclase/mutase family protein, partial [Planctomycetes bacterium]|nr:terpene cyclase/mutase family protein [Planctomycetota bacterium]
PAPPAQPSRSIALKLPESDGRARGVPEPGSLQPVQAASAFVPRIYQLRARSRRDDALKRGGGSDATERAVERGLKWLALHQSPDGRWSLEDYMAHLPRASERDRWHPDWDGRGRNDSRGGSSRAASGDTAATGLALLAFLGHGDTHVEAGPYQEIVRRGIKHIVGRQQRDGDLRGGGNLYMHAIASFAICEAYALTRDRGLEEPARRAIGYAVRTQNPDLGGWRYDPYPQGKDVDTSVFGWMVMAVRSARLGGINVDERAVRRMARYLDSARMSKAGGKYAYQPGLPRSSLAMTAQGFYSQQVLAELLPPEDEAERIRQRRAANESVSLLLQNRPEPRDQDGASSYYWYYATLALFQEDGVAWETWNNRLKEVLLPLQVGDGAGTAAGSWDPLDRRAQLGGRVYSTAISILCLEVYYRYAPKDK